MFEAVGTIDELILPGGGESLVTPHFEQYVAEILDYKKANPRKVQTIVITTNGTVMPKRKLLSILAEAPEAFIIHVSDYRRHLDKNYAEKRDKIISAFGDIGVAIAELRGRWIQTSMPAVNYRSDAELARYFIKCMEQQGVYFPTIWDGRLYQCARPKLLELMGFSIPGNEYVNIREAPNAECLRNSLVTFFSRDFYKSCDYCNNVEDGQLPLVYPGEQLSR